MAKLSITSSVRLLTGYNMPVLGYGLGFKTTPALTEHVCLEALKAGYRHFDSGRWYENEAECGKALKAWIDAGKVKRDELFYTTKLNIQDMGYDNARAAIADSLQKCGLGYIDLFLIHTPFGGPDGRKGAWKALVEAVEAGTVRSIGVSNYGVHHLEELQTYIRDELPKDPSHAGKNPATAVISVGQWEVHPWLRRTALVDWCKRHGVAVQAYAPLTRGAKLGDPTLHEIAKKYGKTPAQVLVRWSLDKGHVPVPGTVTPARIVENADVFDFELSEGDLKQLDREDNTLTTWDHDPTAEPLNK